ENGSRQNDIHNLSRTVEGEPELGDDEWFEAVPLRGKVDSVFFRCQEPIGQPVAASADKGLNVVQVVSVMVAKDDFCRGRDPGGADLRKELLGPRDAAEDNGGRRQVRENEFALDPPNRLLPQR